MIIRKLDEIKNSDRAVEAETGNWVSYRLLLAKDKMGFSLHDTTLRAGTETKMQYLNHLEAVYCIEGEADLIQLPDGPTTTITPGTMYALDQHDHHIIKVKKDFRVICVFNPPCTGREVHDERGAYPLLTEND